MIIRKFVLEDAADLHEILGDAETMEHCEPVYDFEKTIGIEETAMNIEEIHQNQEKSRITRMILESLPDWFGIPQAREEYIADSKDRLFFCAFDGKTPVGFLYLKETGRHTVELAVMGVLREYHRMGIGRTLFEAARRAAKEQGYSFLQVKTVKMGIYAEYDATNRFYLALGFKEFEVFPTLWEEENPCQIYIMAI